MSMPMSMLMSMLMSMSRNQRPLGRILPPNNPSTSTSRMLGTQNPPILLLFLCFPPMLPPLFETNFECLALPPPHHLQLLSVARECRVFYSLDDTSGTKPRDCIGRRCKGRHDGEECPLDGLGDERERACCRAETNIEH